MTNRLSREKSPYLLQHKENPVDWFPWGPEAFEKARKEDKPVFLSIGYSTCHWCHVMEEESFEKPETAALLNEHFVSIKVDREERPDLDSVYMSYVQAVTGSGGWPMSVFLTPDKRPFYGGTYFPPKDRWGMPGFSTLLGSIANSWKSHRKEILESAESAVQFLSKQHSTSTAAVLGEATFEEAFARFQGGFDAANGGFGRAPKFPRSHALSWLLRFWLRTKNAEALAMVERTLEAMACGGIYDQLAGGFHRYSTDARWRIPHFEKMLYDQALLTQTYLEAYQATGKALYARIARETLDYVLKCMTGPEGAFYSAEDADSPDPKDPAKKREGAYFVWEKSEIEALLREDSAEFCAYYGIEEKGNALSDPHGEFENKNVLYVADPSKEETETVRKSRARMLEARAKRPRPHLDDKVLTDWNALMIAAFARASVVLKESRYLASAQKAAGFIEHSLRDKTGKLLHRWREGEAALTAPLNDFAFLVEAHLELYEASFAPSHLAAAKAAADEMASRFWDEAQGGFYLTASDAEVLISRPKEIYDGAIPSGNSVAARALARLSHFTGDRRYAGLAERTIGAFSESVAADPSNYPVLLQALDWLQGASREVVVGAESVQAASAFVEAAREPFFPNQALLLNVSGEGARELGKEAPFTAGKGPLGGKTAVYVCRDHACRLPVTEVEALRRLLQ